jgi:hypothetical protein
MTRAGRRHEIPDPLRLMHHGRPGCGSRSGVPSKPPAFLFPELEGWQKQGVVETFLPETLYKRIDGAAENFLAYDFAQLAVQEYANGRKQTLSAEIYFHGTPENAFGIYSSEKPTAGDYFPVGGQGYAEDGVLNFCSGAYYVKLNSFDLGPPSKAVLSDLAERIARAIGAENALPKTLSAFPARDKLPNSERYILRNFLGHEFLHSAYVADYDRQGRKFQAFIIQAGSEEDARAMLQKYAALDRGRTAAGVAPGPLAINDPYNGPVQLFWRGAFIWGSPGRKEDSAATLEAIGRNLPE